MFLPMHWKIKFEELNIDSIINEIKEQNILIYLRNIFDIKERIIRFPSTFRRGIIIISTESSSEDEMHHAIIFSPIIKTRELTPFGKAYIVRPLLVVVLDNILDLFSKTLILKLNINEIKRPSPLRKEDWLLEDGSNLNSVLYNFYLKENRIPDRIATIISYLFPNINLRFSLTEDQRVYLKVQEDSLELPPVCIADGLYKLLAILSALELKPSLLIIDEIENSLYPKTLETLLDELKSSDTTVIVTTHSPVVVDMIEPEDLVIVEKIAGETKFRRIENPEEIKRKLREAGITFSEGWLYGEI
jgi:AAA15 family ATPase/GTPase